jgi:hypothetical protein
VTPFDTVHAWLAGARLTLAGLFGWLHIQGRLGPLVREALAAQLAQDEARQAGLSVTDEELQTAADGCRRRHGLTAAADTHAWLAVGLRQPPFFCLISPGKSARRLRDAER